MSKEGVASMYGSRSVMGDSQTGDSSFYARVMYVLLDDNATKLTEMDVPKGTIGAIQCQVIYNGQIDESVPAIVALPNNSSIKKFPIQNEVVEIISAITPNSNNAKDNNLKRYYYKNILNVWDTTEHNSIPDQSSKSTTGDFKETGNVSKLIHAPGDFTLEGRFGNTVRFGSSNKFKDTPWSGNDNSPITVITNGQPAGNQNKFEDIDKDGSSFYMLSGQSLPFTPANLNFDSYEQKVTVAEKNKIITPVLTNTTPDPTKSVSKEVIPTKDAPQPVHSTPVTVANTTAAEEEILFLPDNELDYTQIFEDDAPRHVEEITSTWVDNVGKSDISNTNFSLVDIGNLDRYFLAYMQHQQGLTGITAIIRAAKQGLSRVPRISGVGDINSNMYGKKLNPNDSNSGNVSDDFLKYFGTNYTPSNFLKYWIPKFKRKLIESDRKTKFDELFNTYGKKYGVPVSFIKNVCETESSFNPNDGGRIYKGLFAVSIKEFQDVYPGDFDIFNPEKNTNVGVQLLAKKLASAQSIINNVK